MKKDKRSANEVFMSIAEILVKEHNIPEEIASFEGSFDMSIGQIISNAAKVMSGQGQAIEAEMETPTISTAVLNALGEISGGEPSGLDNITQSKIDSTLLPQKETFLG